MRIHARNPPSTKYTQLTLAWNFPSEGFFMLWIGLFDYGYFEHCSRERVGVTGLRPSPLPHHRTCGFPHPAIGTNGFHRSGFYSLSTHLTLEPLMLSLPSMALASTHIHQAFPITTSQEAAAVAAPSGFA